MSIPVRRLGAICVGALAMLAACTSTPDEESADAGAPSVVVPGRPGEPASLVPREQATAPVNQHNDADVRYVRMMIVHHQQALRMGGLAPSHAAGEDVRGLAARITATQDPEIQTMTAWLQQRGLAVPTGHSGHGGHGGSTDSTDSTDYVAMPGMATPGQLAALESASGGEFDRLFLELMTAHHTGAITMATEVLSSGSDVFVEEMAGDVIASQSDEINRMHAMAAG